MGAGWFYTSLNLLKIFKYELSFQIDSSGRRPDFLRKKIQYAGHRSCSQYFSAGPTEIVQDLNDHIFHYFEVIS
jgi:hypothetical protein